MELNVYYLIHIKLSILYLLERSSIVHKREVFNKNNNKNYPLQVLFHFIFITTRNTSNKTRTYMLGELNQIHNRTSNTRLCTDAVRLNDA